MTDTAPAAATGLPTAYLDPHSLPDLYGMGVSGGCMAPEYPDRSSVIVSTTEPYARGDVVVVWFRPELLKEGGLPGIIKRVTMMPPPWVKAFPFTDHPQSDVLALIMLETNDRPDRKLQIRCSDILAIHKVVGPLCKGEGVKVSPEEYMRRSRPLSRSKATKPRLVHA